MSQELTYNLIGCLSGLVILAAFMLGYWRGWHSGMWLYNMANERADRNQENSDKWYRKYMDMLNASIEAGMADVHRLASWSEPVHTEDR